MVFAVLALQDRSKSLKDLCKACQPLEMILRREAVSAPEVKAGWNTHKSHQPRHFSSDMGIIKPCKVSNIDKAQLEEVEEEEEARKGTTVSCCFILY